MNAPGHSLRPQATRARRAALCLSVIAVGFSLGCGYFVRQAIAHYDPAVPEASAEAALWPLVLLLAALLGRMAAAVCELIWLERTWSNLPIELRTVGPIARVSSGQLIGFSVVPGLSYVWKLGVVAGIADGLEAVRARVPYRAKVPKRLGVAAVVVGWVPGLNVYLAPFLWEIFATRIDVVCGELLVHPASGAQASSARAHGSPYAGGLAPSAPSAPRAPHLPGAAPSPAPK